MGWAAFPLRTGDGRRVFINTVNVVEVREDSPANGTGLATIGMSNGRWWFCRENYNTVWARLVAADKGFTTPVTQELVVPQQLPAIEGETNQL